jgi:glycopeptide antibiotics resistance protein
MNHNRGAWMLLGAFALFIVYGTLIPFQFAWPDRSRLQSLNLTPFINTSTGGAVSRADIVQNILLFMPLGALLYSVTTVTRRGALTKYTVALLGGAVLSCLVELLQLFTTDRIVSTTDVLMNSAGSWFGALLFSLSAGMRQRILSVNQVKQLMHSPLFPLATTFCMLVLISMFEPFDISLDVSSVYGDIKGLLDVSTALRGAFKDELRLALHCAIAIFFVKALWIDQGRRFGMLHALGCIGTLWALEGAQVLVGSRSPGIRDALVLAIAAAIGMLLVPPRPQRPTMRMVTVVYVLTTLAVALELLSPFSLSLLQGSVHWLPFEAYYERTTFVALSNSIESLLFYFPAGYLLATSSASTISIIRMSILTLVVACALEYLQTFFGRYADSSTVLASMVGWVVSVVLGRYHGANSRREAERSTYPST